MKPWAQKQKGFTIVELLIVIVVIGILAAITIVAYNGVQDRARASRANSDLVTLVKAIEVARLNKDTVLKNITGSNCTRCSGTHAAYVLSIDKIAVASGVNLDNIKNGDPWGNDYVLDENEGEQVANPCRQDGLTISGSHPDVNVPLIPFYNCPN